MTKLKCDREGYVQALKKIESTDNPIKSLLRFYKEKDMNKEEVFETQFVPFLEKYMVPDRERSLEIGYGPGLLIAAARKHFNESWGVDVHGGQKLISKVLDGLGIDNYKLLQSKDGWSIPADNSIFDFVFSWTVFMHLGTVETVKKYMYEIHRTLKYGGLAVIYFARPYRKSKHETKEEWEKAIDQEPEFTELGPKLIQKINLKLSMRYMVSLSKDVGFHVLEETGSTKKIDGIEYYHGQHGVVIRKE